MTNMATLRRGSRAISSLANLFHDRTLQDHVQNKETKARRLYHLPLGWPSARPAKLRCRMRRGRGGPWGWSSCLRCGRGLVEIAAATSASVPLISALEGLGYTRTFLMPVSAEGHNKASQSARLPPRTTAATECRERCRPPTAARLRRGRNNLGAMSSWLLPPFGQRRAA